jgi:hypothetical protein
VLPILKKIGSGTTSTFWAEGDDGDPCVAIPDDASKDKESTGYFEGGIHRTFWTRGNVTKAERRSVTLYILDLMCKKGLANLPWQNQKPPIERIHCKRANRPGNPTFPLFLPLGLNFCVPHHAGCGNKAHRSGRWQSHGSLEVAPSCYRPCWKHTLMLSIVG